MGFGLYVRGCNMKPGKLYIKIFLSFLVILIITEIIIFGIFLAIPGKRFSEKLEQYTKAKILVISDVIEDKIRSAPGTDISDNKQLKDFITNFGQIFGAKIWLKKDDGAYAVKSFKGEIPAYDEIQQGRKCKDFGAFRLCHNKGSGEIWDFYGIIPINLPNNEKGKIHILFETKGEKPHAEGVFAFGLALLGLIIALLTIPIARFITKPLKELSNSALQIADGDLSHRAKVNCGNEIGELCGSFNHMADRVERMIKGGRELTANISHELRTPLARIRVAEELIREKIDRQKYDSLDRHLNGIREDIEELDKLIGRILDLSKLDVHESPLKFELLEPVEIVQDLLERIQPAVDHKGLELNRDLSFDSPISGDGEALYSVFSNILDNALKFASEGGKINVKMFPEKDYMVLNVVNTFHELSAEELSNLFEPFYRTEGNGVKGSGLGLAMAKKIVELHNGTISAMNSWDGFKVEIRIPKDHVFEKDRAEG